MKQGWLAAFYYLGDVSIQPALALAKADILAKHQIRVEDIDKLAGHIESPILRMGDDEGPSLHQKGARRFHRPTARFSQGRVEQGQISPLNLARVGENLR